MIVGNLTSISTGEVPTPRHTILKDKTNISICVSGIRQYAERHTFCMCNIFTMLAGR